MVNCVDFKKSHCGREGERGREREREGERERGDEKRNKTGKLRRLTTVCKFFYNHIGNECRIGNLKLKAHGRVSVKRFFLSEKTKCLI